MDVTGSIEKTGKQSNVDEKNHKLTYPSLIGIDNSRKALIEEINKAAKAVEVFDDRAKKLIAIVRYLEKI